MAAEGVRIWETCRAGVGPTGRLADPHQSCRKRKVTELRSTGCHRLLAIPCQVVQLGALHAKSIVNPTPAARSSVHKPAKTVKQPTNKPLRDPNVTWAPKNLALAPSCPAKEASMPPCAASSPRRRSRPAGTEAESTRSSCATVRYCAAARSGCWLRAATPYAARASIQRQKAAPAT
ncbi:hypothetical protein DFJ74DRAFT_687613 [Hyaloraphidium curvatum]|nr:hypothetical protein DFJ74DRAFT_687613 [Hyaloraphidium curvatum]